MVHKVFSEFHDKKEKKWCVAHWRDTMTWRIRVCTQRTHSTKLNIWFSEEFRELVRSETDFLLSAWCFSLGVLTQLGQQTAGWTRGELSYIPSIGAVCLPTRSLPVQSREIGREEFPLCVHSGHGHNHTEACVHPEHMCACVCVCVCASESWNWAPSVWIACYFLRRTL